MKILSFVLSISMLLNSISYTVVYAGPPPKLEDAGFSQSKPKQIPTAPYEGTDDFKKLIQKGGFVDKTLFIKDIVDDSHEAILITRPRRWGKSLNMSMLKYFFMPEVDEITGQKATRSRHKLLFNEFLINGHFIDTREILSRLLLAHVNNDVDFDDMFFKNTERSAEMSFSRGASRELVDGLLKPTITLSEESILHLKGKVKEYGTLLVKQFPEVENLLSSLDTLNKLLEQAYEGDALHRKRFESQYNIKFEELRQKIEGYIKSNLLLKVELSKEFDLMSRYQGQYPTILLSLKDVKKNTFDEMKTAIESQIVDLFSEYKYLKPISKLWRDSNENLLEFGIKIRQNIIENKNIGLEKSLKTLSEWLHTHHGKKTYILIDEYDTPLQEAYIQGYSERAFSLMRDFFGSALKGNPSLEKGILTGILRIAKANLFSGLNNFVEDSVLSTRYPKRYGFTEQEVETLLNTYQVSNKKAVKDWYNGYSIGGETIYNPWSVMNYLNAVTSHQLNPLQPYWVDTGGVSLIKNAMVMDEAQGILAQLREGNTLPMPIKKDITLFNLEQDSDVLWPLLLYSGYLTADDVSFGAQGTSVGMRIPNTEVLSLYNTFMMDWIKRKGLERISLDKINLESLEDFKQKFSKLISSALPKIQHLNEDVFHSLITGRFLLIDNKNAKHRLSSEEYVGFGRADNIFYPIKGKSRAAVIHEYKYADALEETWWQIFEKNYIRAIVAEEDENIETILMRPVVITVHPKVILHVEETKHTLIEAKKIMDFFESDNVREILKLNEKKRSASMKRSGRESLLKAKGASHVKELVTRIVQSFTWMRPSFNDNAPSYYQGIHEGKPVQFIEHAIVKDGDCGFHALGMNRTQGLRQLLSTTNSEVREMVADDMFEALMAHEFPVSALDATLIQQRALYQHREEDRLQLRTLLLRPQVYKSFLEHYLGGNGWLSYVREGRGILNALARLNNINVFVWTPGGGQLVVTHTATQLNPQNTVHLLHTHGMTHFNLLEVDTSHHDPLRYGKEVEQRVHFLANAVINNRVFFDDKWLAQRRHYLETGIIFDTLRETSRQPATARPIHESRNPSISLLQAHQKRQPTLGPGFYAFQKALSGVRHLIFKK